MRRSSVLYKEKRIPTVERKNDMEKQEQEERKHIEALDRKIERLQEKVIKKHRIHVCRPVPLSHRLYKT